MSILCLDVGDKTMGIAVSDSLRIVACGIGQLRRNKPEKNKELEHIKELIFRHEVDKLVVGLPINMKGEEGEQAKKVRNFVDELSSNLEIPVVLFDERLSTVEAERILREAKVSLLKRRKVRDKIAATVILQNYLDCQVIEKKNSKNGS
jgi:putative Holliday junction resolvase